MTTQHRLILTTLAIVFSIILLIPNFITSRYFLDKKINLGLDLKGGVQLLLEVDFDQYEKEQIYDVSNKIKEKMRKAKIGYKNLSINNRNILTFSLRNKKDSDNIISVLKDFKSYLDLKLIENQSKVQVSYSLSEKQKILDKVIELSIETLRLRIDSTGTTEPIIQREGENKILLQVPGQSDPKSLKRLIGTTAKLSFHLVHPNPDYSSTQSHSPSPHGYKVIENHERSFKVLVKTNPEITGDMLLDAQTSFDEYSRPSVLFKLNNEGATRFSKITRENIGKPFAIVLDNKILSAPIINSPIIGGSGVISGNFSVSDATELAMLLRTGSLVAPLNIIEERTVGPSLGIDSIESGKKAGIIGLVWVSIFMIISYGILGVFANVVLLLTLTFIFALLSFFSATLTFPGIAGIILTIGMAVDANVLIYERIKEELMTHKISNYQAISNGFNHAFATISDSNITTLIAAILLYIFGIGAIKGFAVTLSIGIFASMFSSVVITRLIIELWIKHYNPKSLGLIKKNA